MSAFVTTVIDPLLDRIWPMKVGLPQQVSFLAHARRRCELNGNRATYRFSYSHVSAIALADSVPIEDEISLDWFLAVMEKVLVVLENRALLEIGSDAAKVHRDKIARFHDLAARKDVMGIRDLVHEALQFDVRVGASANHAQTLQDYSNLFRSIGLPPVAADFQQDAVFADMRVAGPNPVMLQRVTSPDARLPITDEQFQVGAAGDSLAAAMAEARLYMADYSMLDGAEAGNFPNGQKYLAAPIALFVVQRTTRRLMPVAIQCGQRPGPQNPIFTPRDGWNWMIAKTFVEIADGNVHEAVTHLGRTHLSMEPFVVSSLRQLSSAHPLRRLLQSHFEGTLRINKAAWEHLIADHCGVEMLFSASIQAARGLAVKGVQAIDVMNSRLPKTFAARGVDDATALPHYPYRDDAMLYWNAIRDWAGSYVRLYYGSDTVVQQDWELQGWIRELAATDGGRITGLPGNGSLQTVSDLVEVLTFVIFTCSVQHAAVNFPQYDYMAYAPNLPLASYSPVPMQTAGCTEADFVAMLPTLDMAELQMELGYLLGGVHFTQLGQYGDGQFDFDGRVAPLQNQFQAAIAGAGRTIAESNRQRPRPYTPLDPAGIPQSINI